MASFDPSRSLTKRLPPWLLRMAGMPGTVSFAKYARLADDPAGELAAVAALCSSELGLTPTLPQLTAAGALLDGRGVEMDTGEGKTLVGAIAAACHALRGRQVHVLSVNDYLARRDAAWMGPLFDALGITVAAIGQDTTRDERRSAYRAQVLYAAVSEVGYDVLRDGVASDASGRVEPAFDVAIVDEADAVMIDEAVSPLVLAGNSPYDPQDFRREISIVADLRPGADFEFDEQRSTAFLTDAGVSRVERALGIANLYDSGDGEALSRINVALMAVAIAERDVDYVVRAGEVKLVSASRGRVAKRQRWPDGLHAAVEAKEGLAATGPGVILDTVTVQELLGRYELLSGMSGTLRAVAAELEEFYSVRTGRVDRDRPNVRVDESPAAFRTREERDRAVAAEVLACGASGRPVLVGTQSVEESEALAARLSASLAELGVTARVLNARNDEAEAEIVAAAGDLGAVTISTQLSGRGTDILLGGPVGERRFEVLALGGLRVLATGMYPSRRLDAQLLGRAGRQGDPGSTRVYVSMEDALVAENAPEFMRAKLARAGSEPSERELVEIAFASQDIAESIRLDQHRATWSYSQAFSKQRGKVLRHREEVLGGGEESLAGVTAADPELIERLVSSAGPEVAGRACRDIVLWRLDECWSDHLGALSELRDGIHLRALADENPTDAFHLQALKEFDGFFDAVYARAAADLAGLDLDDLAAAVAAAVRRPSSTWTYMLIDNPLGSKGDRAVRGLQRLLRGAGG
ncbi:accessory Sec system translocase SecA2 [Leucobacter komagatae]|uniref:accessory Sec system translocase SecA2 n=1 Tax=Leucobacter komagatae TaxID=55969 RepID=UPI000A019746|nr:accessory Sec system translocase SecA2 [Leucobacter komagatae]